MGKLPGRVKTSPNSSRAIYVLWSSLTSLMTKIGSFFLPPPRLHSADAQLKFTVLRLSHSLLGPILDYFVEAQKRLLLRRNRSDSKFFHLFSALHDRLFFSIRMKSRCVFVSCLRNVQHEIVFPASGEGKLTGVLKMPVIPNESLGRGI